MKLEILIIVLCVICVNALTFDDIRKPCPDNILCIPKRLKPKDNAFDLQWVKPIYESRSPQSESSRCFSVKLDNTFEDNGEKFNSTSLSDDILITCPDYPEWLRNEMDRIIVGWKDITKPGYFPPNLNFKWVFPIYNSDPSCINTMLYLKIAIEAPCRSNIRKEEMKWPYYMDA